MILMNSAQHHPSRVHEFQYIRSSQDPQKPPERRLDLTADLATQDHIQTTPQINEGAGQARHSADVVNER